MEQRGEAVHRQLVRRLFRTRLVLGCRRCHSRLHRIAALLPSRSPVVVFKQQGSKAAAQMPFNMIGQQAQEQMPPQVGRCPDMERSHLEVRFQAAESPFDAGEVLVAGNDVVGRDVMLRQVGANDVDPVQLLFRFNLVKIALPSQAVVRHLDLEMFLNLLAVGLPAQSMLNLLTPPQAAPVHCRGNVGEDALGGQQQQLSPPSAFVPQAPG